MFLAVFLALCAFFIGLPLLGSLINGLLNRPRRPPWTWRDWLGIALVIPGAIAIGYAWKFGIVLLLLPIVWCINHGVPPLVVPGIALLVAAWLIYRERKAK